MIRRHLALVLVACVVAACGRTDAPAPAGTDAALTDPDQPGEEPAAPPAIATTEPAPAPPVDKPASVAAIDYTGVAGVAFGSAPDALRTAWPGGALPDAPVAPGLCHFLYAQPKPQESYGVAFMVEGDKFVRVDVDAPDVRAPGGGHAGMTADEVRSAYAGHVTEQPHKYVQGGKYLVVTPADAGVATRLVFEVDAAGIVTAWRLGLPPQVNYVEGCA